MNFRRSNMSYMGGAAASSFSGIPYSAPVLLNHRWKWENCRVKKPKFVMLDAPVFWILFSCISKKLMPRAKADFTKTNGFKAFSGFWQGNPLIQPQYSADSRIFRAKQGGYPNPVPTSVSSLPSLSPVTHRDGLCAGFKPLLGKIYHEASILACWANVEQRYFSSN